MAVIPVVSTDPTGATTTENPVAIAGVDGGGIKRAVLTDAAGNQTVSGFGATSDAAASSDTGTFSLLAFFKRLLNTYLSPLLIRYPADLEIVGLSGQTATNNNLLDATGAGAATDLAPNGTLLGSIIIDVTNTGTVTAGTLVPEWSADGTTWKAAYLLAQNQGSSTTSASVAGQGRFQMSVEARYFRLRLSVAVVGGTVGVRAWVSGKAKESSIKYFTAVNNVTAQLTTSTTSGVGYTPLKLISAATTNATLVKSSAGKLYSVSAANNSASWRYLKIYSKASSPTVGTDVPILTFGIAPGATLQQSYDGVGVTVATGIAMSITAGIADSDNTAIGANEVAVVVTYA